MEKSSAADTFTITSKIDVSIIIPIHNGSKWIHSCFESILNQTVRDECKIEVCVCNDASTDNTMDLLLEWKTRFNDNKINFVLYDNEGQSRKGAGSAKNKAVSVSSADYLCFQDIDDVMLPDRILLQLRKSTTVPKNSIIGSKFKRQPEDSTVRYTKWANNLTDEQLDIQIYTSHGPTIIMPTWFCHRSVFDNVGGFSEDGKGTPEDLIFFYKHLDLNGKICRIDECVLIYSYHSNSTTFSIHEDTIWKLRLERLETLILSQWTNFTIWNAGRAGRKLYKSLTQVNKDKVNALCDVDVKKIKRKYTPYDPINRKAGKMVDIVHFKEAVLPFVICVKMDMTNGDFEKNLELLNLKEGKDYIFFS